MNKTTSHKRKAGQNLRHEGRRRTSYYAFGLQIPGISSHANKGLTYIDNRYKANGGNEYQSKEFSDGSGLELYDAGFRGYDAQTGRFTQQDPLAEIDPDWSPYVYVHNNPVAFSDPWGLTDSSGVAAASPDNASEAVVVGHKANCRTCSIPVDNSHLAKITPQPVAPSPVPSSPPAGGTPGAAGEAVAEETVAEGAGAAAAEGAGSVSALPAVVIIGGILAFDYFAPKNAPLTTPSPTLRTGDIRSYVKPIPTPVSPPDDLGDRDAEQYTLRARKSGFYPEYRWGKGMIGGKWLDKGDIWKIGTTVNGQQGRYSLKYLGSVGQGLSYVPEYFGPNEQVIFVQNMKLLNYRFTHNGELPPGNTKIQ